MFLCFLKSSITSFPKTPPSPTKIKIEKKRTNTVSFSRVSWKGQKVKFRNIPLPHGSINSAAEVTEGVAGGRA